MESKKNWRFSSSSWDAGAVAAGLRHVIAPFVIELGQLIELFLELLIVRGSIPWSFFELLHPGSVAQLFQHRVGFHFLLHQVAQFEQGGLPENEQALLELGRTEPAAEKDSAIDASPAPAIATVSSQPQVRSAVVVDPNDPAKVLQQLQQMKAANEETIRKQEAMLQHLDELQKTTEQLRILISRS
jgi:hypothetical protein